MLAQLLLAVFIIAGLHEWGHMIAARLFHIRVEQFSIGFPPRIFSKKWKETEYILGAVPLGGYVKLSGMVDESLDVKKLKEAPKPYEFRAKPAWQRIIVMLGGIIVNLLTGILVFSIMSYLEGDRYLSSEVVKTHGVQVNELGEKIGLRTGDKIVSVHGMSYHRFKELRSPEVFFKEGGYYEVIREGIRQKIPIPPNFVENFSDKSAMLAFILPRTPFRVKEVLPNSAANTAGLKAGDSIVALEGKSIRYFDELRSLTKQYANQPVELQIIRKEEGNPQSITLKCRLKNDTLGIVIEPRLPYTEQHYSLLESVSVGASQAFSLVWLNALGIAKIVRGHVSASKSLAGPVGIAQMFGGKWQWKRFWYLVGLISVVVAIFNLLPIPALDGGHVVFCLYEMVVGRSMPLKILHYAQTVGMALLIGLMAYVLANDILKLF